MILITESIKLSAVILTYNDASTIRRTLSRLYWCDEIIIVDSYSTDNTVAICRQFTNCTVYLRTFQGYGEQKQYAVSRAGNDWILSLDPDEVLLQSLSMEIYMEFEKGPAYAGYRLASSLVFSGKEFLYGRETWRYRLRLFNKKQGNFTGCAVGEEIVLEGPVRKMHNKLLHYRFRNLDRWEAGSSRQSAIAAAEAHSKGRNRALLWVVLSLPAQFLKYYLLHLNLLNGTDGFYWSVLNAYYHFSKSVKIRERFTPKNHEHVMDVTSFVA